MVKRRIARRPADQAAHTKRGIKQSEYDINSYIGAYHHQPEFRPAHGDQGMIVISGIKKRQADTFNVRAAILINQRLVFYHRLRAKAKVIFGVYFLFMYSHGWLIGLIE